MTNRKNQAMALLPQTLDDIVGQNIAVNLIKSYLEEDKHPYALFISGNSGTGKGALVINYIKALHCENRKPGSYIACGKCNQCKLDPKLKGKYNDVIWIQPGKGEDTINKQVKEALLEGLEPPRLASINEAHRYYKVIVFDELQSLNTSIIENLLFSSETEGVVKQNRIIFIMITMSEHRLSQKDPELMKALVDRTDYIKMKRPTKAELAHFTVNKLKVLDPKIINLLIDAANYSYRGLIRCYARIEKQLKEDPDEDLCAELLYTTSARRRKVLWTLLNKTTTDNTDLYNYYNYLNRQIDPKLLNLKEFWLDTVEACHDETQLLNALLDDLDSSRLLGKNIPIEYDKLISDYLVSDRNISSWHIIKRLKGKNLIDLEIFDQYNNHYSADGIERRLS
jgi:DNA polymerase III delta prime subunit